MWNDLKFAVRTLRRSPGFTAVAVLSLALGIGANTAIFSLVDRVLMRSLPVSEPDRLVLFRNPFEGNGSSIKDNEEPVYSNAMYRDVRARTADLFTGVAGRARIPVTLSWRSAAERATAEVASGNYFDVLGVRAALGRTFTDAEDAAPGAHPVAVLSWPYYLKRFGGDPSVVGSTVRLNGQSLTVIGVASSEFSGLLAGSAPDIFIPIAMKRAATPRWDGLTQRNVRWLNVFARLAPGVTREQAESRVQVAWRAGLEADFAVEGGPSSERYRKRFLDQRLQLIPAPQGINETASRWRTSLIVLMSMVGLVLLIACANVASLMIARAAARKREFAVRVSLGAGVWTVVRQLLLESLLLAAAAGVLAIVVASWTSYVLLKALDAAENGLYAFRVDARVLLFATAVSLLTAVLFGLAPALQSRRLDLVDSLKAHATSIAGRGSRMRKVMVGTQMALATVLLIASALFSRSFYGLLKTDPGFRAEQLVSFGADPTTAGYDTPRIRSFYEELQRRVAAIPGVTAVGIANPGPFTGNGRGANVSIAGYKAREDENMSVGQRAVSPGYFRTMGTRLLAGREFTEQDSQTAPKVVVVNDSFVKRFLPGTNPIGVRMAWGAGDVKYEQEIVGVVASMKHNRLREDAPIAVFMPYAQEGEPGAAFCFVRSTRDVSGDIRRVVASLDAQVPVARLRKVENAVADSVRTERLIAGIATAFGALATLLAAIGVYGVIAYSVVRRTGEIGIRIALGADRRHVLGFVIGEIVLIAAAGQIAGLAAALAAGKYVRSQLYGIEPNDPATVAAAACALAMVGTLAALIPARRAARTDPMRALRFE